MEDFSIKNEKNEIIHSNGKKKNCGSIGYLCCYSVAKLCPTLMRPHGLQHARLPCPPLSPRVCSNSCPLSQWCHPIISSSATPFCPQSFPASGSFPMSQLFAWGGQSIGASASVLPMNFQGWFPLGLTDWTDRRLSLYTCSPRDSQEFSLAPQFKSINSSVSFLYFERDAFKILHCLSS